jgi:putative transposase
MIDHGPSPPDTVPQCSVPCYLSWSGNERQDIFQDDEDRKRFLQILIQSINIYSIKLYSYVFMFNHFHLLLETPKANLSEFMRKFNIIYTGYYNRRHSRVGHLYQGRYKSVLVDKNGSTLFVTVVELSWFFPQV